MTRNLFVFEDNPISTAVTRRHPIWFPTYFLSIRSTAMPTTFNPINYTLYIGSIIFFYLLR